MKKETLIEWDPVLELHVRGTSKRGHLWIRLDREKKVSGLYTHFDSVVKYIPETEEEFTLEGMKLRAEKILELHDFAEQLALLEK